MCNLISDGNGQVCIGTSKHSKAKEVFDKAACRSLYALQIT